MLEQTTEVQELSLEKVIETKLVQANVTEQVLAALKEKYSGLKLQSLDDKESYLEIKAAARECAKVRNLTVSICKKGREDAVKTQKAWIAKEKEVIGKIAEVENILDAETTKFDAEVQRKENEERQRKEEVYINRQAALTKMGAKYEAGSFILGEASFEASLVKGASQDVWEEAVIPKFQAEYEKIEAVRVQEEKAKAEHEAKVKDEQEALRQAQETFRLQQEEFKRQQELSARLEREKMQAELAEKQRIEREAEYERMKAKAAEEAEAKRLADIEAAIKREQERKAEEERQTILRKQQEEERKKAELDAAGDKVKWESFIKHVANIETFEMRSGMYRNKMKAARQKIDEILSL